MRIKFAEKQNRAKCRPIHATIRPAPLETGSLWRLTNDALKDIGYLRAILQQERSIEVWIRERNAAAERRFSAELFEDQLLNRVVENPETCANAQLPWPPAQFRNPAIRGIGAPGDSDARSKRLVVGGREAAGYTRVSWENQTERLHGIRRSCLAAIRAAASRCRDDSGTRVAGVVYVQDAWIFRGSLPRAECLQSVSVVGVRSVQFPPQAVIQRQVGLQFVAVLRKKIERRIADR